MPKKNTKAVKKDQKSEIAKNIENAGKKISQRIFASSRETRLDSFLNNNLTRLISLKAKSVKKAKSGAKEVVAQYTPEEIEEFKKNFGGYWLLKTIEDWSWNTLIYFFVSSTNEPMARFFDGPQNHLRSIFAGDNVIVQNPIIRNYPEFETDTVPVTIVGPKNLVIHNTPPPGTPGFLSTDQIKSTFRIQDFSDRIAVGQFWTDFDGSADDVRYGTVENLSIYCRLCKEPNIQEAGGATRIDYNNPVNIFNYVNDYYYLLAQPQKNRFFNQNNYIGQRAARQLFCQFLNEGVVRKAAVSTKARGNTKDGIPLYIGVWRTNPLIKEAVGVAYTTIITQRLHKFNGASTVEITGFQGDYAVLNGTHKVITDFTPAVSPSTPFPWQCSESREPFIYINFDSSDIPVPYDPNIHGIALITAHHGPVTPEIGYRDFMAALIDYNISVWGPGTHTRIRVWSDNAVQLAPETWEEVAEIIFNTPLPESGTTEEEELSQAIYLGANPLQRFRTFNSTAGSKLYHNPFWTGSGPNFGEANINDPFGLGTIDFFVDPLFDYDIDINNYLEPGTAHNVYWTITGPILEGEPITSRLVEQGYPSNGSQVHFITFPHQEAATVRTVLPPPLVDEFGTHPYRLFAAAKPPDQPDNISFTWEVETYLNLVGGIIRKDLTGGRTIGYFRIGDEDAFDDPFYQAFTRSLVFGTNEHINSTINYLAIAALAPLLEHINSFNPDKYIMDTRFNGGGFANVPGAYAALFGGNRPGIRNYIVQSGGDNGEVIALLNSGLKTGNDSLQHNNEGDLLVNVDEVASAFPNAVVRARRPGQTIELIILTDSNSASAGDLLPHYFLGPDPNAVVQDIGNGVIARIVGDIDGRLWAGVKYYDGIALNQTDPIAVHPDGSPASPLYLAGEGGIVLDDRHGTMVNEQPWTRPAVLLPKWYDATTWVDLGYTNPTLPYPLDGIAPQPTDPTTWRDIWLEYAIDTPANPSSQEQVSLCAAQLIDQ